MTLRELLYPRGVSRPKELAAILEVSPQYASMLMRGKKGVGRDVALKLHDKLGIPLEDLLRVEKGST